MTYRFLMLSDERDDFKREIRINADSTFKELNDFIINDIGYDPHELTTFYLCDDQWNKLKEVTLMDMGMSMDDEPTLMDETLISDLIEDKGQKLLFVFDMLSERAFFLELAGIITGDYIEEPITTIREGKAPKQISDIDTASKRQAHYNNDNLFDENMYGDEDYSLDELDSERFSSLDDLNDIY